MNDKRDESRSQAEPSYVLAHRDYADIAHLENPTIIERVLAKSREEAAAYVGQLLKSGVPRYLLAGPKVAFTAMTIEALTDLWEEISAWRKNGTIPDDFAGRPSGYQTWVDLLKEIDSDPVDADRLKAMKAMFLAANKTQASDGESILGYQLFTIAKNLSSGQLLLLRAAYGNYKGYARGPRTGGIASTREWRTMMASNLGHKLSALIVRDERKLVEYGLIAPWTRPDEESVPMMDARMTDLGIKFCQNLETYDLSVPADKT